MPDDCKPPVLDTSALRLAPLDKDGCPDLSRAFTHEEFGRKSAPQTDTTTTVRIVPLLRNGEEDPFRARTFTLDRPLNLILTSRRALTDNFFSSAHYCPDLIIHGLPPTQYDAGWKAYLPSTERMDIGALARHIHWNETAPAAFTMTETSPNGAIHRAVFPSCRPRSATSADNPDA